MRWPRRIRCGCSSRGKCDVGTETDISWAHHTHNAWRGCERVSPACDHCYAETMSKRNPAVLGEWGPDGTRVIAAESYWNLPLKWDRMAREEGRRHRVFSLSLGDVFEDRPDLVAPRERLFNLAYQTKWLDWLFLTKRPENIQRHLSEIRHAQYPHEDWWTLQRRQPRPNWWFGVTAENQQEANRRLPILCDIPASVRFVSCEPLLGPVDLRQVQCHERRFMNVLAGNYGNDKGQVYGPCPTIQWVISGGESGAEARPSNVAWYRLLRDQCQAAGVAFHHKQWGEYCPFTYTGSSSQFIGQNGEVSYCDTGQVHQWDEKGYHLSVRVGKKRAGRLLDGKTWDEFPQGVTI